MHQSLAGLSRGFRSLICAIIEQAITDYQALETAGIVMNGAILRLPSQGKLVIGMDRFEVQALVELLTTDELDRLVDQLPVEVSADGIRRVLGIRVVRNSEQKNAA